MTPEQLAEVPDKYLRRAGTDLLRPWLERRGWTLTLAELDTERRRRGITPQ